MALEPGTRLGHYEISEPLGKGGMGEVYRARDTKLNRDVALKILPEAFANDSQRLGRFQREAQVLASLNHPNIGAIYGLEDSTDTKALVLEIIEGPTLAERIAEGPIPVEESLKIALQIAEALEAAHEKGIIHRDLKPANVKITPEGTVKVLDFGLAKAMEEESPESSDMTASPTLSLAATKAGVILGTAAYMSPEQARGKPVDNRSDIFAFGVLLHEMVTGRSLFAGKTISDTLAAVLTREPDWSALPVQVRRLLRACLEREPESRLRDMGDARLLIDDAPVATAVRQGRGGLFLTAAAALVLGAVATSTAFLSLDRNAPQQPIRFLEYPPAGRQFVGAPLPSPDGRFLAMRVSDESGRKSIWVRSLDSQVAREIDGTEGVGLYLFLWSPDSTEIVFAIEGEIRRVRRDGSGNRLIARLTPVEAGVWAPDGDLYISKRDQGIVRLSPEGGTPRLVLDLQRGGIFRDMDIVPDGSHLLLFQFGEQTGIYTCKINGGNLHSLKVVSGTDIRVLAADQFLYQDNRVLLAQRFDPSDMTLLGDPLPIAQNVGPEGFEASRSGVVTFIEGGGSLSRLTWFDRMGNPKETVGPDAQYSEISLSPKGDEFVYVASDPNTGNRDLWLQDLAGNPAVRFTSAPGVDHLAVVSPGGRDIAWEAHSLSDLILMRRPSNGSVGPTMVREWNRGGGPSDWSPDGKYVLYSSTDGATLSNIWAIPMTDDSEPFPLIETEFNESMGRLSPDGRWIAYMSDASGRNEIYLQRLNGMQRVGGPQRVSTSGGAYPLWRRDGAELYFVAATDLMAVDIQIDNGRPAGVPKVLFDLGPRNPNNFAYDYAVTPDGQSVLAIVSVTNTTAKPATVILGWHSDTDR